MRELREIIEREFLGCTRIGGVWEVPPERHPCFYQSTFHSSPFVLIKRRSSNSFVLFLNRVLLFFKEGQSPRSDCQF